LKKFAKTQLLSAHSRGKRDAISPKKQAFLFIQVDAMSCGGFVNRKTCEAVGID
jgi:hypothetical protein